MHAAMKDDLTEELLDADGDGLVTSADILALRNRGVPASSIEAALEKMQASLNRASKLPQHKSDKKKKKKVVAQAEKANRKRLEQKKRGSDKKKLRRKKDWD